MVERKEDRQGGDDDCGNGRERQEKAEPCAKETIRKIRSAEMERGRAEIEKREDKKRREDKRPAKFQGGEVIKTSAEGEPDFFRVNFCLEEDGDREIVKGENKRKREGINDSSATGGPEDMLNERGTTKKRILLEIDGLQAKDGGEGKKKSGWPQ